MPNGNTPIKSGISDRTPAQKFLLWTLMDNLLTAVGDNHRGRALTAFHRALHKSLNGGRVFSCKEQAASRLKKRFPVGGHFAGSQGRVGAARIRLIGPGNRGGA